MKIKKKVTLTTATIKAFLKDGSTMDMPTITAYGKLSDRQCISKMWEVAKMPENFISCTVTSKKETTQIYEMDLDKFLSEATLISE